MEKKTICFVDDDPGELERFRDVMSDRYIVGTGEVLEDALQNLGGRRPDFFLLDLVYGKAMSQSVRNEISAADEELTQAEEKIRRLLCSAGQSADGGFDLARRVHEMYPGVPRAFFSRKAFLGDALKAHEQGLPVLEKPDPDASDIGTSEEERYRSALKRSKNLVAGKINQMIESSKWWVRNREWVRGLALGIFFALFELGRDLWKIEQLGIRWAAESTIMVGMVVTFVLAWPRRWPWRGI
ncbi:MAG TPA: hypothetical protein VK699_12565 [Terriglobales bacterium]|jgi:hypothetical protein|nr:hypothetical protein [Terriglobales bacterium]